MTALAGALRHRREGRGAGESGFTLIEVLLVVGITGLLLGPLLAWTVLVMRQQPVEQDGMIRTAQASLLRTHFAPDVTSAGAADDYSGPPADNRWETWRQECIGGGGEDGRSVLVLLAQRGGLVKTIYSVAPARDGSDDMALWRDRCAANTGELIDTTQVVERVLDDPARTRSSCWSGERNGEPDAPCRRVSLQVAVPDAADLVELSATRRADARSLDRDADTGNILPIAIIDVERTPSPGSPAVTVRLSGARSTDPDGDDADLAFRWELPTGPEGSGSPVEVREGVEHTIVLTELGSYVARLTVTDADGGASSTYRRIAEVTNQPPTVHIDAGPSPAVAGESVLQLSGAASSDPDGTVTDHQWRIYSELDDAEGLELLLSGANAQWAVPEWAFGNLVVELTVTDDLGKRHSRAVIIPVIDPLPPPGDEDVDPNDPGPVDPGDPGDPDDPDPDPGAPVAAVEVQIGANRQVTFDASGSSGQGLTYEWDFGLLAGTGTGGPQITHTYPAIGTYTARLTVRDDQGRTGTRSVLVVIPGQPLAPTGVRVENGALLWDPRPGARRYFVALESTSNSCARSSEVATAASAEPRRALPPNPCGAGSTVRARVGTEATAGGPIAWSAWINVPNEVTK